MDRSRLNRKAAAGGAARMSAYRSAASLLVSRDTVRGDGMRRGSDRFLAPQSTLPGRPTLAKQLWRVRLVRSRRLRQWLPTGAERVLERKRGRCRTGLFEQAEPGHRL